MLRTDEGIQRLDEAADARINIKWSQIPDAFKATPGEAVVWSTILGTAMRFPRHIPLLVTSFKSADFPRAIDRLIFASIEGYWSKHKAFVAHDAIPSAYWEAVEDYMDAVVSEAGFDSCLVAAREYIERRNLATGLGKGLEALATGSPVHEVRVDALTALASSQTVKGRVSFATARDEVINSDAVPGMPTGLKKLDELLTIRPTHLGILAARPGVGKSTLMRQIAMHAQSTGRIIINTLEMSPTEVAQAMIGTTLQRNAKLVSKGGLGAHGVRQAQAINYDIEFHELTKVSELEVAVRAALAEGPVACVMVDYLQLMSPERMTDSQNNNVAQISRALKIMAGKLNVPVIALSQLSRSGATEEPELWHLRDSGAIEQDANWVMFIHPDQSGFADQHNLLLKKQRSGSTGTIQTRFDKTIGTFWEI
jgi:KaiC/GvpD/RAD55 family RecA-like ATPase